MSYYPIKTGLKNVTVVDTSSFTEKTDKDHLKYDVDKLYIDKLKNVPTNLSTLKNKKDKLDIDKLVTVTGDLRKPNDIVKKDIVQKDVYNT